MLISYFSDKLLDMLLTIEIFEKKPSIFIFPFIS